MRIKKAVRILIKELRKDEGYYHSWQSNIAMAFKDKYYSYKKKKNKRWLNQRDIHEIANESAKNFLNLLMKDNYDDNNKN